MKNYTKELFIQKLSEVQFPIYSDFENVNVPKPIDLEDLELLALRTVPEHRPACVAVFFIRLKNVYKK